MIDVPAIAMGLLAMFNSGTDKEVADDVIISIEEQTVTTNVTLPGDPTQHDPRFSYPHRFVL